MNNRIRALRKAMGLTLDEFGNRIGLKKSTLSLIENKKTNVTEQTIRSICREFNVNENWLRDGNGNMFDSEPTSELDNIFKKYGLSEDDCALIKRFVNLPQEQRNAVTNFLSKASMDLANVKVAAAEAEYEKSLGIVPKTKSVVLNTTADTKESNNKVYKISNK